MSAHLSASPLTSPTPGGALRPPARRAQLARLRRSRQLAGDERAGTWARAQARRAWWSFVRARWRLLAAMAGTAAVVVTTAAWFVPDTFARGLVVGAGTAATLTALGVLVVQATGTAQLSSGATAEQWTASELRHLRTHGWRIVNHVALEDYDIDHVLVGPGGVIAAETKWSHRDWRTRQSRPWLNAAAEQAQGNARTLRLWLKAYGITDVTPVVFCWSAHRPDHGELPNQPGAIGTTQIVYGTHAADAWRDNVLASHRRLATDQITRVWDALDHLVAQRDTHPTRATAAPPTLNQIYWTGLGILIAFTAGLLTNLNAFTATDSWAVWTAVTTIQALIGITGLRFSRTRLFAVSWLIALSSAAVIAAGSVIISAT